MTTWNAPSSLKCSYLSCPAGHILAQTGNCPLNGIWWHPSCPFCCAEEQQNNKKSLKKITAKSRGLHQKYPDRRINRK
ncbi:MAG: hypothetical protein HF978_20915 [Desulfobacteraceae bacterium]|nr:hypothetical protein [Desulfobacteraceae bacterium]MBC2758011.1 hypothetical protein [Desulfobacteraceae bacterium]